LAQLGIFDNVNIKNWRSQVPDIIVKFDKSSDGNVSLKEFFAFLGVESYAPNIVQKMTKIFAKATEKG
jgi:Ca2+-binding EF-hand superfamily protein